MSRNFLLTGLITLSLALIAVPAKAFTPTLQAAPTASQQKPAAQQDDKSTKPKLTPEQLAAIKAQNEKALKFNALVTQFNADLQAKNWEQAVADAKQLIELEPESYSLYQGLGNAQFNSGHYTEALQAFDKGLQLAESAKDPKEDPAKNKAARAQMLAMEGNCYIKLRKDDEAIAAYEKAAALDPHPATAYFNLCATQYNMGRMSEAAITCEKAIAADPTKADAYFIRGSALYGNGSIDKDKKYVVPAGTVEALNKYLELAPNGAHAEDVKAMLEALGAPIKTTFSEKKR